MAKARKAEPFKIKMVEPIRVEVQSKSSLAALSNIQGNTHSAICILIQPRHMLKWLAQGLLT